MYPGVLDDIQRLFPKARITSGYRGPNNPLTRRNPSSAHAHGNPNNPGAVDVAPIPGVSFENYVSGLKSAGIPVTGARDEQANPVAWTTGPNWHVSLDTNAPAPTSSAKPKAAPMPQFPLPQPNLGEDSPLAANQDYSSSILASLPALKGGHPGRGKAIGAILGTLGDALMAYGGLQPEFAPYLRDQQSQQHDDNQFQQRLAAEIEARKQKLSEPPQFVQNLQAYMQLPDPLKRQYLSYLDATNPIAVSGPQGTQRVPRSLGPQPGTVEEGYVFLGGDPADQSNWRPQ